MKTRLILVRHGESEANRHKIFAGWYNADLHPNGLEQAKLTAEYIAGTYPVEKVYASDLKRAWCTGEAIAERLGVEIIADRELREINAGEWDGARFERLVEAYPEDFKIWLEDIGNARPTGGEAVQALGERVMTALRRIAGENPGRTIGIATHATPIRAMQTMVEGIGWDRMKEVPWVSNASVTVLDYEEGRWTLQAVNEDAHLGAIGTRLPANA